MGKRCMDLVVGVLLATLTLAVVAVLAVLLAAELRAWPFFVQRRVGRDGRHFSLIKLRTLPPTTPAYADKYALSEVAVPPIARQLRRLHLDELPQLWLVVAGRMSLVGPRPEMPHLVEQIPADHAEIRQRVRPGCTGLWQVSVDAGGLIHEHPEYDRAYVLRRSWRLDAWILMRTALLMLGRPGAAPLHAAPLAGRTSEGLEVVLDDLGVTVPETQSVTAYGPTARSRIRDLAGRGHAHPVDERAS